ncbi:MAG: DNA polymerase III subunit alpha [Planctomycetota bacterium]|nr:DNA polymerase III subunit alpha [Planctomycetota bacterium]
MSSNGTDTPPGFVHLHLHSEYSLLDGGNRMKQMVARVKELGMEAVAVTDHGNLFGVREFYAAARSAGVKPILGIEAYVAETTDGIPCSRRQRGQGIRSGGAHLVLLARNGEGWRNLMHLSSDSFVNGFYGRPRMDHETLAAHARGLIAINGHLGSSIAGHLRRFVTGGDHRCWEAALEEARWHAQVFGPDEQGEPSFFVELQRHNAEQESINPLLAKLARELSLPMVCDNDAHFLRETDHDVHDTLCCISMGGKLKDDPERHRYPGSLYVKSPAEMATLFPEASEALANTVRIAARCQVILPEKENHAPVVRVRAPHLLPCFDGGDLTEWFKSACRHVTLEAYVLGSGDDDEVRHECDRALRLLCDAGAVWRYGPEGATGARRTRLDRELGILCDKRISPYFLIVWDFVNWARQNEIPAMARGSGVGTMVGFVLGLSNADPEAFGLLFERFTDPDRTEYPDIDIDFCQDGRGRVIDYVRQKYGYVAQIITFNRMKARAAIKDVGRVMGFTPDHTQRLCNLVPEALGTTLQEAIDQVKQLRDEIGRDAKTRRLFDHAMALEGHARSAGVHAAGVIIATQPLENIVPLYRPDGGEATVTQWDGPTCEKAGLLKMDFLGLRTLSTIELTKRMVRETLPEEEIWRAVGRSGEARQPGAHHPLDLDRIATDDQRVFESFRRGQTQGIFQFESDGMKRTLQQIQPDRLEDLIAAAALFRPGPMESIPLYASRKLRKESVPNVHPVLDAVVAETYGIMVYQEQVMQVLNRVGGIPLRQAYSIIKAISKKKESEIAAAKDDFVRGAGMNGISAQVADAHFATIQRFAGYGFNKSHSAGYAILAYQTAYLKTYFPAAFMAAVLTYESQASKVEDWRVNLDECRVIRWPTQDGRSAAGHVGIEVAPPDINQSGQWFSVRFAAGEKATSTTGHIRFGLAAIKGSGESAIRAVIKARGDRPFKDLMDFCERVDLSACNRATVESLVKAGALDSLHGVEQRAALVGSLEEVMRSAGRRAKEAASGQMDMFGGLIEPAPPKHGDAAGGSATLAWLRSNKPWDRMQALAFEKEVLGMHVSGHPLDLHRPALRAFCNATSSRLASMGQDAPVVIGGILGGVRPIVTKSGRAAGQRMALFDLMDMEGKCGGVMFAEEFAKYGALLQSDAMVVLIGHVDRSREQPGVKVNKVIAIEDAASHLATRVEVLLESEEMVAEAGAGSIRMLAGVLRQLSNSVDATRGRTVEVHVVVPRGNRRVRLVANGLRIVPSRDAIAKLRATCEGRGRIVVAGGWTPAPLQRRDFSQRWRGGADGE